MSVELFQRVAGTVYVEGNSGTRMDEMSQQAGLEGSRRTRHDAVERFPLQNGETGGEAVGRKSKVADPTRPLHRTWYRRTWRVSIRERTMPKIAHRTAWESARTCINEACLRIKGRQENNEGGVGGFPMWRR